MKKIIKSFTLVISLFCYFSSFAESWSIFLSSTSVSSWAINLKEIKTDIIVSEEKNQLNEIDLENELKKDWIELNSATNKTIIDKANEIKNVEVNKLFWKTVEENNINTIENVLETLEIKKELANNQLAEIENNLKILQKNIEDNNKTISSLKDSKNVNQVQNQLEKLEEINNSLKEELEKKEKLLDSLNKDLEEYNTSNEKYQLLMSDYIKTKTEKDKSIWKEKIQKLYYLLWFILLFAIIYIIKILLIRNEKFIKKNNNFWEYFDLLYWITIIIFLVMYIFYLFPELYALLIFISWSLIFINAQIIASFVASLILFRHFKIWDVVKIWTEKWKIVKMNPLNIIIKKINDYWVIENEEINIPNIDFLKEKVTLAKNSQIKENIFSIILSLKWNKDIFEIIDNIKENIFNKMLGEKLTTLNPNNLDTFKTKYEHTDQDKVKITFYWLWNSELNRKIEKKIIQYIKDYLYIEECSTTKKSSKKSEVKVSDNSLQKVSIIEEEANS